VTLAVTTTIAGNQPPSVAELVRLAVGRRLTSTDLDEAVEDAAANSAGQVNSEGLDGQIEYLVRQLGSTAALRIIEGAVCRSGEPAP
jgi:hypothetical protein